MTFSLVFISFIATALFLFVERSNVLPRFRTTISVSIVYVTIAAINYYYMMEIYDAGLAAGAGAVFPTKFRYIDWLLTTPLMLLKFPLLLGMGDRGFKFMVRLIVLDVAMVVFGYLGEVNVDVPAIHWGFFIAGCVAWIGIATQLFFALIELPDHVPDSVKNGVRVMGFFLIAGWAVYPLGFFAPLIGLPTDARELIYNIADFGNKIGLCLLVYRIARQTEAQDSAE